MLVSLLPFGGQIAFASVPEQIPTQSEISSSAIPAPLPGAAPTASVNLSPTSGYITQAVTVSGQTNVAATQVRIAWIYGDGTQTLTASVVPTTGDSYSAQIGVPTDALPGPAQVCATTAGFADAKFTCANFTITEPPAGSVKGQLPDDALVVQGTQAINATFHLFDRSGQSVASTPVGPEGSFQLDNVAPGEYNAGIEGDIAQITYFNNVIVNPGLEVIASMPVSFPLGFYIDGTFCAETAAKVIDISGSPSHLNDYGQVSIEPWFESALMPGPKPKPAPTNA
jgi:hypothetical protein